MLVSVTDGNVICTLVKKINKHPKELYKKSRQTHLLQKNVIAKINSPASVVRFCFTAAANREMSGL